MALELCKRGHYFDSSKGPHCPFCAASGDEADPPADAERVEVPAENSSQQSTSEFDPPVGWLVAIDGASRGSDFRIRAGNNSIGRLPGAAICISGDPAVSPEEHAFLLYDPGSNRFSLRPGRGGPFVNGRPVQAPVALSAGDKVLIGGTTLLFIPLSGEKFRWS